MRARERDLAERLADERGHEVVFVSHCLLNENTRYLGGAFTRGAVPEMVELVRSGVGIHQMPCPEMRAWGGVNKRLMLAAYGLDETPWRRLRRPVFRLFVLYTRARFRRLARQVARDLAGYGDAGVRVRAILGVGGSPSCGAGTTLDLRRSFDVIAQCPLARMDRRVVNERAVAGCAVAGDGLFTACLREELARRGLAVPFGEFDLLREMRGLPQRRGYVPGGPPTKTTEAST